MTLVRIRRINRGESIFLKPFIWEAVVRFVWSTMMLIDIKDIHDFIDGIIHSSSLSKNGIDTKIKNMGVPIKE